MSRVEDLARRLRASAPPPQPLTLSRSDIVRYAGASGDFNPVHHSEPFARDLGYPGVFAMGLLPGGILASAAQRWCDPAPLARLSMRFAGLVWPDVTYTVVAAVRDGAGDDGGVEVELRLDDDDGATKVQVVAVAVAQEER